MAENFGEAIGLDLWIGLPAPLHHRAAQMIAARAGCGDLEEEFSQAMALQGPSPGKRSRLPQAPFSLRDEFSRATLDELALVRSVGSAVAGQVLRHACVRRSVGWTPVLLAARASEWMTTRLSQGVDKTLHTETAFSAGFMMDPLDASGQKTSYLRTFISAFGHPGAGGSLAFADPENRLGFAYVMNQMESGALPKSRALALVHALYDFP